MGRAFLKQPRMAGNNHFHNEFLQGVFMIPKLKITEHNCVPRSRNLWRLLFYMTGFERFLHRRFQTPRQRVIYWRNGCAWLGLSRCGEGGKTLEPAGV